MRRLILKWFQSSADVVSLTVAVREQIKATRASTSDKLSADNEFPQSSYVRWTTNQYTDCCLSASTRVYHTIPASGSGAPGTNYDQTTFETTRPNIRSAPSRRRHNR